ncbi:MAG TPA: PKD domain-containing protein [Methanospirillum sp.]|nr:PKD domain-containing protein [Methanospirillum sp.]
MIHRVAMILVAALLVILACWGPVAGAAEGNENVTFTDLSSQPVQFIKNMGQAPEDIRYQVKSPDFSFDFSRSALLISGLAGDNNGSGEISGSNISPVVVTLEGAREGVVIEEHDQLPGYANFLIGQNESDYQKYVPWFGSIVYADILPGVNLTYTGRMGLLKREYTLMPGVSPDAIQVRYTGATNISITEDGSLLVRTPFGDLTEAAPVSYQDVNGTRVNVTSSYVLLPDGRVGFSVGAFDPTVELVIDPYLEYSTYLGGGLEDYGMDIAMDADGNAYVTGYTSSCDFPLLKPININAPISYNGTNCHTSRDAFVTKITQTTGNNATIEFSTYLGGGRSDFGRGIAVDSEKDIYICGDTFSEDFPVMLPIQNGGRLHGSNDAFVTKIRKDGAGFWYSSYLGGNFADQANDIALDSLKAVYITGMTTGNSPFKRPEENFPTTSGAYQTAPNPDAVMGDAFAVKFNPTGNALEYSSYISGSSQDVGNGIAVDGEGKAYIVGTTSSGNLIPVGTPGYLRSLNGAQDAFIFKMNFAAGSPPVYTSYLGGATGYDYGEAVAVDTAGSAYVTGATASTDFPVTTYAAQKTKGWPYDFFEKDAYVTKFSTGGTGLDYSTYLGGSSDDWGYGIAVDNSRRAYVTGYTKSEGSFPMYDSLKSLVNGQDGFLTCVKADGSGWVYSTVFGGERDEVSHGVATSTDGNTTLLTGYTSSYSIMDLESGENCYNDCFPVERWINQTVYPGGTTRYFGGNFTGGDTNTFDAFVMKFGRTNLRPEFSPNETCGPIPLTINFTDNSGSSANIVQRIWNFGDGGSNSTGSIAQNVPHTYTSSGTFPVTLTLITYSGSAVSNPISISACNRYVSANFTVPGYESSATLIDVPRGASIPFSGYSTNYTPASWEWNFADSTANSTGRTPVHQFSTLGIFNVTMTGWSGGCCTNVSAMKRVRVQAPPYADFVNTSFSKRENICAGAGVSFNDTSMASATNGSPTAWQWNFGDNSAVVTTQNVTDHVFQIAGNYTITLTASNVAGSSTKIKPSYVNVYGNVYGGFEASPVTGTAPLKVNFTDKSTGVPTAWSWTFGDGNISAQKNPSNIYSAPGVYTVNLTSTSFCGPSAFTSLTDYITVNGNMSPTILFGPNLSVLSSGKYNGTNPLTVKFLGNTTDGSLIDQAWWTFGDGNETIQYAPTPKNNSWFNVSHQYSTVGDFTPILKVSNLTFPGTSTTGNLYTDWIGVAAPMNVNFTVSPQAGIVGQQLQFTDTSTGSPTTWHWLFGDGSENNLTATPKHAYATSGNKPAFLEVWNKYGQYGGNANRTITITSATTSGTVLFNPSPVNLTTGANWRKVALTLDRADNGLSSYTVKIDLNSTNATNFGALADRPSWIDADKFAVTTSPAGKAQSITMVGWDSTGRIGYGSRNVSLGNITLYGSAAGNAVMALNTTVSEALYGSSFMGLSATPAPVRVDFVGAILGNPNPPNDLKPDNSHDGLLDDFNGNGVVNSQDVTTFFNAWAAGSLSGLPAPPFDYNHNGRIDTDDIVEFFNAYSQW